MAFAEKGAHAAANGTTPVDIVASPITAHTYVVRNVVVHNRDTIAHGVIVQLVDSVGAVTRRLAFLQLDPNATLGYEYMTVLDATTKKIQVVLAEAIVTTQPDVFAAYGDVS